MKQQKNLKGELDTLQDLIEEEEDTTAVELLSYFCRVNLIERKLEALEHRYSHDRELAKEKVLIK